MDKKALTKNNNVSKNQQQLLAVFRHQLIGGQGNKKMDTLSVARTRQYQELWENAPVAYHILDTAGTIIQANKTEAKMLGYSTEELIGRSIFDFILPAQREEARRRFKLKLLGEKLAGKSVPRKEERVYVKKDGTKFYVSIQDVLEKNEKGKVMGVRTAMIDITERVRALEALEKSEKLTQTINTLLRLSNTSGSRKEYLEAVIKHLQDMVGFKYAGIRILDENRNIPYDAYVGFSYKFWQAENFLSSDRDQCACIRVIRGRPDSQEKSVMTAQGSFQCNNLAHFFSELSRREQKRYRGTCLRYGFNSLAVIPFRFDGRILGAIHVADKKRGQMTAESVEFIEALVPTIGEAINKFNAADKLRESNELLRKSQEQLVESYRHLGVINRKISLLLDIEKHPLGKKKKEVSSYILNSAMRLAQADAGLLYSFDAEDRKFRLFSQQGFSRKKLAEARKFTGKACLLFRAAVKNKTRMQGHPEKLGASLVPLIKGAIYILMLPLVKENKLKGVLLLEFLERQSMDSQELEFFDIFSMHASLALSNAGILK